MVVWAFFFSGAFLGEGTGGMIFLIEPKKCIWDLFTYIYIYIFIF